MRTKMWMILISLCLSCIGQSQKSSDFSEKILSDYRDGSYFVSLNVTSPNWSGCVIIENASLYYFLNEEKHFAKTEYESFMIEVLKDSVFEISENNLSRWGFIKVKEIESINNNFTLGKERFIKIYFDGRVLKSEVSDDEKYAIISKLYELEVPTNIDDESGFLVISDLRRGANDDILDSLAERSVID